MNFLELAQRVAAESGTVSGTQPTSVENQTGRLAKIVNWTAWAWTDIQNRRTQWRWMRGEFEKQTLAGTARYTSSSWALTSFADWMTTGDETEDRWSCYLTSEGAAGEGPLYFEDWDLFYRVRLRGPAQQGRPIYFSVSPAGELVFSPTPDAVYTIRGPYRKGPWTLTANTDTPDMPVRFHMAIVYRALVLLGEHDEAFGQAGYWNGRYEGVLFDLERDQLPAIRDGSEAIA